MQTSKKLEREVLTLNFTFTELVDTPRLQELTDDLYEVTGIPSAVVDMDGVLLTGAGWQRICTDFHRRHPQVERECAASDTKIRARLDAGEPFVIYRCPRGLIDASSPVTIEGERVANVFSGQVFLEPPDEATENFFREQARQFGFDEGEYIEAFRSVPVFSEEQFRRGLSFLKGLASFLGDLGLARMKELQVRKELELANRRLEEESAERRRAEMKFRTLYDSSSDAIMLLDRKGFFDCNQATVSMFGCATQEAFCSMHPADLSPDVQPDGRDSIAAANERIEKAMREGSCRFEWVHKRHDTGEDFPAEVLLTAMELDGRNVLQASVRDISERKKQNQEYETILRTTMDGFWIVDAKGRFLDVNYAYCRLIGYSRDELLSMGIPDVEARENQEEVTQHIQEVIELGSARFERQHRHKDGHLIDVEISANYIPAGEGKFVTFLRDITERKRADNELRESQLRLERAVKAGNVGLWDRNLVTNKVFYSSKWKSQIGYEDHEIGPDMEEWRSRVHPDDLETTLKEVETCIAEARKDYGVEFRFRHKDGSYRWIFAQGSILTDETGHSIRMVGSHVDITERKRAESALAHSHELMQYVISHNQSAVAVHDKDLKYLYVSQRYIDDYKVKAENVIGKHHYEVFPDLPQKWRDVHRKALAGEVSSADSDPYEREDGSVDWTRWECRPWYEADGAIGGIIVYTEVITERKRAEDELRESEERFRRLFEDAPLGYQSLDESGNFIVVNETWCRTLGYTKDEVVGRNFSEFIHPDFREVFTENFPKFKKIGSILGVKFEMMKKDGTEIIVSFDGKIGHAEDGTFKQTHCVLQDITEQERERQERERLQSQLRQSQKMEAIGTMAGGIAHDFNNILGAIIGYSELALGEDSSPGGHIEHCLHRIRESGERAADLVKHILTFSRQGEQKSGPVPIVSVIKEALRMLQATLPSTIEIRTEIVCGAHTLILGDATQMHQVIVNLSTNAHHAMEENGGVLKVRLSEESFDTPLGMADGTVEPGEYLKLTVRDTGHGMSSEVLDRVLDPFFTTKATGKGTGMGLSVVHGIVKSHGGTMTVESEPGEGTTVEILLPKYSDEIELETAEMSAPVGGSERILLVDDEEALAEAFQVYLRRLGYRVEVNSSGFDALARFRDAPEEYDLVVTDQTMPQMTGGELAEEIRRIRQDTPIILCTGHSDVMSQEKARAIGIRAFMMKPVRFSDLAKTIRQQLDSA